MKFTKLNEKFVWGQDQEAAKNYVCAYLSKKPLLTIYDPTLEMELHTDASSIGFGVILFQRHDRQLKVVSYYPKRKRAAKPNTTRTS